MTFYAAPYNNNIEPNQTNVRQWLDGLYSRFQPIENARWNEANLDSLFYAGAQEYVNQYFGYQQNQQSANFYFNISQQPINMVTGYQRQHRKSLNYIPSEGADPHTTDQYTRLMTHVCNSSGINEAYSKACELSAISGLVLMQPYLDYIGDDPAQGTLKLKVWEFNSFLVDPFAREPDFSDAQFIWCQEYISKQEAETRFPDKVNSIYPMAGTPQRYGNFYFLPENYNMARNDLLVLSYVWYKSSRKKKRLYSKTRNQFFDYSEQNANLEQILYAIPDLQVVEVNTPTWKLAVVLNDQMMYQGENPLDSSDKCPFIPVFWNYEPHLSQYRLRSRSLMSTMRSSQFLLNRRICLNHAISESSINTGYKRKVGAVANEDNLKRTGAGWDILINEDHEMTDVEKIIPNAVPPSDMELANQLSELVFSTSGVNLESWQGEDNKQMSSITLLMKQAANLMVLQKYFDQWDYSFKTLGERLLSIVQNNWNASKVGLILGEEPSPHFYSHVFAKYQVVVEEGLNTATQKQQEFIQWMELNQAIGGIIPPSEIAKRAVIQGKNELVEILANMEQQQAAHQEHAQLVSGALEEAKLKELYSKSVSNMANARERHGRTQSDLGLYEERLSMVAKNRATATKDKSEAALKLLEAARMYGDLEAHLAMNKVESKDMDQRDQEQQEEMDAQQASMSNDFVIQMLAGLGASGQ